ncbi:radical SAM protein [Dehalobacterium formicoaceticum]|uniref:radical SAM protein n=1 Tax=Dehalobacterium formicoaceticum TaxID=51515 RepID=UPI000B7ED850|nr:radical SAM protein [Dehalobacterium formicoaceticum]
MKQRYHYGPVRSRRLGRSLGVDVMPHKTCSLDCIYCECGATSLLTLERKEYLPTQEIIDDLDQYLKKGPELDYITFAGSGEPTLHSGLGKIINFLKEKYPQFKVAVLTNATLLNDPMVIDDLQKADLVVPSLDGVSTQAFEKMNRPAANITPETIISGIKNLKENFSGEIWLEIFIIPEINDSEEELALFKETIEKLGIKKVQLNTLDRPGAVEELKPVSQEYKDEIAQKLGQVEIVNRK